MPDEDELTIRLKHEHDFRTVHGVRSVYTVGMTGTGSLGVSSLIRNRGAPAIVGLLNLSGVLNSTCKPTSQAISAGIKAATYSVFQREEDQESVGRFWILPVRFDDGTVWLRSKQFLLDWRTSADKNLYA